jgi:hypothetical protein
MRAAELQGYSITAGGPLHRVESFLDLLGSDRRHLARRIVVVIAFGYLPLLAAAIGLRVTSGEWPLALQEIATHVRILVVVPLLFFAEESIERRGDEVNHYLAMSQLLGKECAADHRSLTVRLARLRDASLPEVVILAAALATGLLFPAPTRETEPVILWSRLPAMVIGRFLALRLIWRWFLWGVYLFRLSRLRLRLRVTHPDRVGGLKALAEPSVGFAFVVMAGATSVAASWGDRMRFEGFPATAFMREALTYIVVAVIVAIAPLTVFTPRLAQARRLGGNVYGAFAKRYSDAFEHRWLRRPGEEALGTSDLQSLNDLGGSFERAQRMRTLVAPLLTICLVVAGAVIPMLPLVLAHIGAIQLLMKLVRSIG